MTDQPTETTPEATDDTEFAPAAGADTARLEADNADLIERNEVLAQEKAELINDLRRLQADFVNHRNRTQKEFAERDATAAAKFATALLPVLDDLEAMRSAGDLVGPFASIVTKLEHVLESKGVVRHGEIGEAFDPSVHEAVLMIPSEDVPSGAVVQVTRYGYRAGEQVIRATQVIVAA